MAGLVGSAKNIVQLRPRNPESPVRSSIPVKAICDYRQIEVRRAPQRQIAAWFISVLLIVNQRFDVTVFRLPSTKRMSAYWPVTLTGPSGKSSTQQATRPWCPLFVSLCLHPTKRLLTWLQGEMLRWKDLFYVPYFKIKLILQVEALVTCFLLFPAELNSYTRTSWHCGTIPTST